MTMISGWGMFALGAVFGAFLATFIIILCAVLWNKNKGK